MKENSLTPEEVKIGNFYFYMKNRKISKRNTTGITGVMKTKNGKWYACLTVAKKRIISSTFDYKEDAITQRKEYEKIYWGEKNENSPIQEMMKRKGSEVKAINATVVKSAEVEKFSNKIDLSEFKEIPLTNYQKKGLVIYKPTLKICARSIRFYSIPEELASRKMVAKINDSQTIFAFIFSDAEHGRKLVNESRGKNKLLTSSLIIKLLLDLGFEKNKFYKLETQDNALILKK